MQIVGGAPVNWDLVYDSFVAYTFSAADEDVFFYWHRYRGSDGRVLRDPEDVQVPYGLYINEPPPFETFYNRKTQRPQRSRVNVRTVYNEDRQCVEFITVCRVKAGDELLMSYGPFYDREGYEVNPKSPPFPEDTTDDNDVKRVKRFREQRQTYKPKGKMFKRQCSYDLKKITLV
jgi:hypothetical protein